jgi:photosystem II stability/assembly factor-like uncharacterized protein
MKTFFTALFLALSSASFAQWGAHSSWEPISPIEFASIAKQGSAAVVATATNGYIYISNDFGDTWHHQCLDDTMELGDIEFYDSLHGIVNATSASGSGVIFLTEDGCESWSRLSVPLNQTPLGPVSSTIHKLAYPSVDTFYACDGYGLVWSTTDKGQDWNVQQADTNWLNGIYFLNSMSGFIVGRNGCFSKTTDAGQTWTRQDIGAGDSTELDGMDFYNRDTGLVYGFGYTYITTDGGMNWLLRPTPASGHGPLYTARWVNNHHFYALTNPAYQVYELMGIDSQMTVFLVDSLIYAGVTASIYDSNHGALAVGYEGLIMRSPDGIQWEPVSQYTVPQYGSLGLPLIFGDTWYNFGGMFERSTDEGYTWRACSYESSFSAGIADGVPAAINFSDSLHGLAFNSDLRSASVQTSDGGLTWTNAGLTNVGPSAYAASLGNTVLGTSQVGDTMLVWKSTDNGRTFAIAGRISVDFTTSPYPNEIPDGFTLGSLDIVDENTFYAFVIVTDTGLGHDEFHSIPHSLLYSTTDGGSSWSRVMNGPETPNYGGIYFSNKNNGYIGCDSGALFRTKDGGVTWNRSLIPMSSGPHYVETINFKDSLHGYLGTNNTPNIFATSDGGETWQADPSDVAGAGNSFLFLDSNTVLANIGAAIYKRTITPSGGGSGVAAFQVASFGLSAYPNPFTSSSTLTFSCAESGVGEVSIFNMLGTEVARLYAGELDAGEHSFTWDASSEALGMYECMVRVNGNVQRVGLVHLR